MNGMCAVYMKEKYFIIVELQQNNGHERNAEKIFFNRKEKLLHMKLNIAEFLDVILALGWWGFVLTD